MKLDAFSGRAQTAVQAARDYAADLNHARVMPAHVVVALLNDESGLATEVIRRLGADPRRLTDRLHRELGKSRRTVGAAPVWDQATESALGDAQREARRRREHVVRTHHLLIAIVDGAYGTARRVLQESGVTRTGVEFMLRDMEAEISREKKGASGVSTDPPRQAASHGGRTEGGRRSPAAASPSSSAAESGEILGEFGRDLTELARDNKLDPIIGRDAEIRRLMQVIGRRTKNNPILVGEAGVGKTAIVEGLARRIASGDVPKTLRNKRIVQIDMGGLVAGTSLRGQFEARVRKLVQEVAESEGTVLLYIDEIHTIVGAGGGRDSGGAANMLKPALSRGEITLIGTTTPAEYRKHIESDKALERRFQEVAVEPPSIDEAIAILRGIKGRFEIHHGVQIMDSAVQAAVRLSERYVMDRNLPDKAVDLIDEAASQLRLEFESQPAEVDEMKRRVINLEVERETLKDDPSPDSAAALRGIEAELKRLTQRLTEVDGILSAEKAALERVTELQAELEATEKLVERAQNEDDLGRAAELKYGVIKELEKDLAAARAALESSGNGERLLREHVTEEDVAAVVGEWTGVPVTRMLEGERKRLLEIEERLSSRVVGQDPAVSAIAAAVRRSRAGVQDGNRPIGNFFFVGPTGVGKTELAKALADFLFDSEDSLIRIDMSEYMEQSKVNTLIGAAYGYVDSDKGGVLTEAVRRRPYSVVLFDEAEKAHPDVFNILLQVLDEGRLSDSQGRRIDFTNTIIIMTSNVGARQILDMTGKVPYEELDEAVHDILRDHFKPEFLNRLDDTVVFNALDRDALDLITGILIRKLNKLLKQQKLTVEFTDAARAFIVDVGYQPEYGARPLKRALLTEVQDPLALEILEGNFVPGDHILIDLPEGSEDLVFTKQ